MISKIGDMNTDEALRKHVIIEAIDTACRPLQLSLSQVTDQEEIKKIRAQMRQMRYRMIPLVMASLASGHVVNSGAVTCYFFTCLVQLVDPPGCL